MYSSCLFCHAALGANTVVEHFPVGKCLSFDAERGRLWVVCPKCRQWNLTPLEERWEAIEECERLFRDSRKRLSTDQIGLARTASGLDLVRIGKPQRPEFAAWRYGAELGRRRTRALVRAAAGIGAVGAAFGGLALAGAGLFVLADGTWWLVGRRVVYGSQNRIVARIDAPGEGTIVVRRRHLADLRLTGDESGWQLGVPHGDGLVRFEGREAIDVAGRLLPRLNHFGAKGERVNRAVALLEESPDPMRLFGRAASTEFRDGGKTLGYAPPELRLALEMAAHEESERRALEGELASLEAAWKEAEEIAGIADNLLLPKGMDEFFRRSRGDGR